MLLTSTFYLLTWEESVADMCFRDLTPNPDVAPEMEVAEPVNELDALEARRKRREAIRAKHRSQATPLHLKALNVGDIDTDTSMASTEPPSAKETSGRLLLDNPFPFGIK